MSEEIKITFLGGLGEIGRNCAVFEQSGRMLVLDCGVMFPNPDMPGVDLVLPDFSYILQHKDQIDGIVLTHGHEDHVGALPYLLRDVDVKLYGSRFALEIARGRIEEAGISLHDRMVAVKDGQRLAIGPFDVEFIPVTHSVPCAFAIAIHTVSGVIFHSGDFKIDLSPVDNRKIDLGRIGQIAKEEGIALLLADSTNADKPGFTDSESSVGSTLGAIFASHPDKRVIVACFASHIHRIQQLANAAAKNGRKVALVGRSMVRTVSIAKEIGILNFPNDLLIDIESAGEYEPGEVCVISTGSQGEPMSVLTLLASGDNKNITLTEHDFVVFSSHVIPGNEWSVAEVMNNLARKNIEVIDSEVAHVHASGHASRGELATLLNIASPRHFIPVHGERKHLLAHAGLAAEAGVEKDNILICEDGDQILLSANGINIVNKIPAPYVYVDGTVGEMKGVLRDRRFLADNGVVAVTVTISGEKIIGDPCISSRGWLGVEEEELFLPKAISVLREVVTYALITKNADVVEIKRIVKREMSKLIYEYTKRRPVVIPMVVLE